MHILLFFLRQEKNKPQEREFQPQRQKNLLTFIMI